MSLLKKLVFRMLPRVRFTISYIRNIYDLERYKDELYIKEHEYFVPYVCPLNEAARERTYFRDGKLNIIEIGKFRPYKNHYVVVDAAALLRDAGRLHDITFTILGQASYDEEKEYFDALAEYIHDKGLDEYITLRKNIPYSEMGSLYQNYDVFILSSFRELASISILESMANAVPPISTSYNGTACYIREGETGLIFETENPRDLADKIEYLSEHRERVPEMGANGYRYVKENCMFENYYAALDRLLRREFGITLGGLGEEKQNNG